MSFCPQCGTKIEDDAAFCANCGTPVRKKQQPNYQQPVQPKQPEVNLANNMDLDAFMDEPTIGVAYPGSFDRHFDNQFADSFDNNNSIPKDAGTYDYQQNASFGYDDDKTESFDFNPGMNPSAPTYQVEQNGSTTNIYVQQPEVQRPGFILPTNRSLLKFILLSMVTFGIYGIVVMSGVSTDINTIASRYDGRRTMHYCLILFIFSWLTFGIVPLIWCHNLCDRIGNELIRRNINYQFGASTFWLWGLLGTLILVGPFIYTHKLLTAMNLLSGDFNQRG